MTPNWNKSAPLVTMATLGVVLAGCAPSGQDSMNGSGTSSMSAMMTSSSGMMEMSSSSSATVSTYQDGTYSATGHYTSPAGAESVEVTLTLKDGVVTDAQFTGNATHPASKKWQGNFAAGFKDQVVGKKLDEIKLGVVNGSSLAPKGFMDAVAQVKAEASA